MRFHGLSSSLFFSLCVYDAIVKLMNDELVRVERHQSVLIKHMDNNWL